MRNTRKKPAHTAQRRGRPLRAAFGLLSAALGAAALVAALAPTDQRFGLPPLTETTELALTVYGALMFVLALWTLGTSGPGKHQPAPEAAPAPEPVPAPAAAAPAAAAPAPRPVATSRPDVPDVITPLRNHGWYVAEKVALANADADYVAVGPAGVLVVQTMVSNVPDPRGRASIRARIAAQQFERILIQREVHVEVVPAVIAFGPGQDDEVPGGVRIVDNVAILFGDRVSEWFPALTERVHIDVALQERVAEVIGDILEGTVRTPQDAAVATSR